MRELFHLAILITFVSVANVFVRRREKEFLAKLSMMFNTAIEVASDKKTNNALVNLETLEAKFIHFGCRVVLRL